METTAPASSSTPWHLWAIGLVALLWNGFGAYDYLATVIPIESYLARFTPEQRAYFDSMPVWATSAWAIAIWTSVAGSIALLLRSRWAVWLFGASLAGMAVSFLWSIVLSNGMEVMGPAPLIFTVVIVAAGLGFFFYSRAMAARGVLR